MGVSDKMLGSAMLATAAFVFTYYTVWALFLPFLPPESPVQSLFPDRIWAIRIPILLLLTGISGIGLFLGKVMLGEARKRSRAGKKV